MKKNKEEKRNKKIIKTIIFILVFILFFIVLGFLIISTLDKNNSLDEESGFTINSKTVSDFNPEGNKEEYSDNSIGKKMCLEVPSFVIKDNGKINLFIKNSGDYNSLPKIDLLNEETEEVTNLYQAKVDLLPSETTIVDIDLKSLKGNKLYIYNSSESDIIGVKYLIPIK